MSTLPMCNACQDASSSNAAVAVGFSSGGHSALGPCVFWIAIGIAVIYAVSKAFAVPRLALAMVIVVSAIAGVLICRSAFQIARTRSHAVDTWQSCDFFKSGGPFEDGIDGPHASRSEACAEPLEDRREHRLAHPGGDVLDGFHQILYRFKGDQLRVLYLPAALLLGLLTALIVTVIAERRRPRAA